MRILSFLLAVNAFAFGGKSPCQAYPDLPWCDDEEPGPGRPTPCEANPESKECACSKDPESVECKPCERDDPRTICKPTEPGDFDWSLIKKWGGKEITINKDVQNWEITQTLESVKISGGHLESKRSGADFRPCFGSDPSLQGTFNAIVNGKNGWVAGTFDYERCSRQNRKTLGNLEEGGTMAESFGLEPGSEICFFMSCNARSSKQNCKQRSTVKCTVWK
jgi:hypothetical protein